jgi:uncharacterized protein YodC (DUF2158 family)
MKVADRVFFDVALSVPMSITAISKSGERVKCQWLNREASIQEAWFHKSQLVNYKHAPLD